MTWPFMDGLGFEQVKSRAVGGVRSDQGFVSRSICWREVMNTQLMRMYSYSLGEVQRLMEAVPCERCRSCGHEQAPGVAGRSHDRRRI